MAGRDTASAQGRHVPYIDQRFAATCGQGCPIGGENDRVEGPRAAFGCLGLFPGFPVPQTQAPVIAHTRKALSIRSKSHPPDCPQVTAERLDLSALRYIPDAHGPISTARGQELAIGRSKGQGADGPSMSSQQLALFPRSRIPQPNRLVNTPRSQQPTIRGKSDCEHFSAMAGQRPRRPLSMTREARDGCKRTQCYRDREHCRIKATDSLAARDHHRPLLRASHGRRVYCSDDTLAKPTEMPCLLSPKLLQVCMSTTKAIRKSSNRL